MEMETIGTYLYRYQAEMAKGLLDEEGIACVIQLDDVSGLHPELNFTNNRIRLRVRSDQAERARQVIEPIESVE
jgi:hypothetical protein